MLARYPKEPRQPSPWAEHLRAARLARGMTQTHFADLVGLRHAETVSKVETGDLILSARRQRHIDAILEGGTQ